MLGDIKPFGLFTKEEQVYMKSQLLYAYVGGSWLLKTNNNCLNLDMTYKLHSMYIKNLGGLQDCLSCFLTTDYPFIVMDQDQEIRLYGKQPVIVGDHWEASNDFVCVQKVKALKRIPSGGLSVNIFIDWRDACFSLHPMEDELCSDY